MNLNEKIIKIRVALQKNKLKKSGKNKFAGFEYYELADFLPTLNTLMESEKINDIFTITDNEAILKLKYEEEINEYKIPFIIFETPLNKSGTATMQDIQYLGALNTYYKRYLYLNAFGITDGEIIDALDSVNLKKDVTKKEEEIDYRKTLVTYIKSQDLDFNEIAKEHKLNAKSSQDSFKKVLEVLQEEK